MNKDRLKPRSNNKNRQDFGQSATCWNYQKLCHLKKDCRSPKIRESTSAYVVTEAVDDAMLLAVHTLVGDLVTDLGASFHTTSHQEKMRNYIVNYLVKVYLVDGQSLDVVPLDVVHTRDVMSSNRTIQSKTCRKIRHIPRLKNLISIGQLKNLISIG